MRRGLHQSGRTQRNFNPPTQEKKSGGVKSNGLKPKDEEKIFSLKKAPKEEIYLLNLALMSEKQFMTIRDMDIITKLSHKGVCETFQLALLEYGQNPDKFAMLTALLSSKVDCPSVICQYLESSMADLEPMEVEQLITDCGRRVLERFMKNQIQKLSLSLKSQPPTEQMKQLERIMNIHRDKHRLGRH